MSDDSEFKEEVLKHIRNFEDNLLKKVNTKIIELNIDYKKFHDNLDNLSKNNKNLIDSLINKNINIEKISSLEQFRNKVDSMLITHEIRINNNIAEISSIRTNGFMLLSKRIRVVIIMLLMTFMCTAMDILNGEEHCK